MMRNYKIVGVAVLIGLQGNRLSGITQVVSSE